MTTLGNIIDQTLNEILLGTYRAHFNQLAGAITSSTADIVMKYPIAAIGEGSLLAVDQELIYVIPGGINETAKTMTCIRGVRGTTAVSHLINATVEINPRFPRFNILNTMLEESLSWPSALYRTQILETAVNSTFSSVDLFAVFGALPILHVVKVWRQKMGADSGRWIPLSGWRFETDLAGAGKSELFLKDVGGTYGFSDLGPGGTNTIRMKVALAFGSTPWAETTDPLATLAIPASFNDILKYGAAWRLIMGRETRRLFTEAEGEGRKPEEVPVQANSTLARQLKGLRDNRIGEEINRLRHRDGLRRST